MPLKLKIESLRARGELSADERDRLIQLLDPLDSSRKRIVFFTPLRGFLLGVVVGIGVVYLAWGWIS